MSERAGHHRARKSLGQNFLIDPNLQRKIVEAIDPGPSDEVLEIGPGTGALTRHLAGRVRALTLVELDTDLAAALQSTHAGTDSVRVINQDILTIELSDVSADPARLKVIGNIPYNITTPIIFHLLERPIRPSLMVLMVQREVADRILAAPGGKDYGALAVGVQSVADAERVLHVRRTAFRPVPGVDSTVVRITPYVPPPLDPEAERSLRVLTRTAFGHRRKQFQRILRDGYALTREEVDALAKATGFDFTARPETFTPPELARLAEALDALRKR